MIHKRLAFLILAAFVVAAPLLASGEMEPERREVTFMLDWVPNVNHVGVFVAQQRGFFEDAGLDVEIIQPGEVPATSAVVSGKADFGIDFQENLTLLRADDVPLVSIAAMLQTNTSGFAVRAGEGIETPADFKGLTYGSFQSPFEEPTLNSLVRCVGGDPSTIEYVPAGRDLLAMLQQEKADIVWIYYGTQGFQAQRIGLDIKYFPLNDYTDCIPDYYTPVVIASESTLENRPELTRDFLEALARAHSYVMSNPEESARILAEEVPELNEEQLLQSVPWLAKRMKMDAPQWGYQEASIWRNYADWMQEVGVLETEIDPEAAFTNDYLPAQGER
jgi:ABC-type nitrate/sulfonate/bicarbonate transport system substrate-binding protein